MDIISLIVPGGAKPVGQKPIDLETTTTEINFAELLFGDMLPEEKAPLPELLNVGEEPQAEGMSVLGVATELQETPEPSEVVLSDRYLEEAVAVEQVEENTTTSVSVVPSISVDPEPKQPNPEPESRLNSLSSVLLERVDAHEIAETTLGVRNQSAEVKHPLVSEMVSLTNETPKESLGATTLDSKSNSTPVAEVANGRLGVNTANDRSTYGQAVADPKTADIQQQMVVARKIPEERPVLKTETFESRDLKLPPSNTGRDFTLLPLAAERQPNIGLPSFSSDIAPVGDHTQTNEMEAVVKDSENISESIPKTIDVLQSVRNLGATSTFPDR